MNPKQQPEALRKFLAFMDKTSTKIFYSILAFILAIVMFYVAMDTGSLFDYFIVAILLYLSLLDAVTVVRRMRARKKA
jgi:hypothetical protein